MSGRHCGEQGVRDEKFPGCNRCLMFYRSPWRERGDWRPVVEPETCWGSRRGRRQEDRVWLSWTFLAEQSVS